MSQKIHELNEQLSEARAGLVTALAEGAETAPYRERIAYLEGQITDLERQARAEAASARRAEAESVEEDAAALSVETQASVDAAVEVPGLTELAGEPLPAVEENTAIAGAAREVARCRAALERAEAALKPAAEQARMLVGRLTEKREVIAAIKARRLAGDERAGDAADLALLEADAEALRLLVDDASLKAAAADTRPAARLALNAAEAQLAGAHRQATYQAALERLRQAESVFIAAWRGMVDAGRAAGASSPWSEYKASPDMTRAVTGAIVPGFRGQL